MIIEQVEALKTWLTNKLSPICDAEPIALAKYVCALVKKDKPEQDLRDICSDQLDVFLQQKTKPFVDELFEALKTKSYIPADQVAPKPPPAPAKPVEKSPPRHTSKDVKDDGVKKKTFEISSTTDDKESKEKESTSSNTQRDLSDSTPRDVKDPPREVREPRAASRDGRDRERDSDRDRRDSWKDERGKDNIRDARDIIRENRERERGDTREVREPRDRDHRDRDNRVDFRRRRTRSRSFSPRRRDFDDRRRRYDDRPRYSPDRRWARRRSWSRSPRRNRSPLDRGPPRGRSRSPRLRSRSPRDRLRSFRSRSRSRSPRPRSWSRPGSGGRYRSRSPSNIHLPDSRGSTPVQDNDYSTLISSSTNDMPAVTSTVGLRPIGEDREDHRVHKPDGPPLNVRPAGRARCMNFEEKGFCMLGDVCPYDHGTDPVVVEDVPMPNVIQQPPPAGPPSSGPGFMPPDLRLPPPGLGVRVNLRHPPPSHVEPYLPEAPRMGGPMVRPHFMTAPPPDLRRPPPGMMLNRPPPPDPFYNPQREIVVNRPPVMGESGEVLEPSGAGKEPTRIVIPTKRPYSAIEPDPNMVHMGAPPPRMAHINQHHHLFGNQPPTGAQLVPQGVQPPRKGFDYNRLGNRGHFKNQKPAFRTGNLTLEVRKIPPEMNNIAKLNEHFGKFGTLTNIQVKFEGDSGAALISFSNNGEATAAYRSPEPVFNNRFIKLFWHNPEKAEKAAEATEGDEGKDREIQVMQATGGRVGDGIEYPSLVLPVRTSIPPAHKLQLDNTKTKPAATPAAETAAPAAPEKSIVYTSSIGNLKKTVFNPGAAASSTSPKAKAAKPMVSPTAVKTADFVSRIEAIKRAEEEKKIATVKQAELEHKRHELLAKQIQQQKVLIETLEKKKAVISEEEKKGLLQALKTISDAIDKVKYGTGAQKAATATFQVPAPAQFKYVSQDQSRKEILDLELEVIAKQSKGEDTSALRLKVQDLANKAQQGAPVVYGRGKAWGMGRGSSWSTRGRGRGGMHMAGRTSLDNRPKTVEVKGFDLVEVDEVKVHFQRFGDVEKFDLVEETPSLFVTYFMRTAAEMAIAHGGKFKKKMLTTRWNQMIQRMSRTESVQSSELDDDDVSVSLASLDEDALLATSGDDRSEIPSVPSTPQSILAPDLTTVELPESSVVEGDSRDVLQASEAEKKPTPAAYERSLSEDLLAGDENFKASYTDDEDEEDHITVTVSNTGFSNTWQYSSPGETKDESVDLKEDIDDLANLEEAEVSLDDADGSWL